MSQTRTHGSHDASRSANGLGAAPRLAVIAGDGIGREVTAEALKVLDAVLPEAAFTTTHYDLGAERYLSDGQVLPDAVLDELKKARSGAEHPVGGQPQRQVHDGADRDVERAQDGELGGQRQLRVGPGEALGDGREDQQALGVEGADADPAAEAPCGRGPLRRLRGRSAPGCAGP